jgi:hypothetical protein
MRQTQSSSAFSASPDWKGSYLPRQHALQVPLKVYGEQGADLAD